MKVDVYTDLSNNSFTSVLVLEGHPYPDAARHVMTNPVKSKKIDLELHVPRIGIVIGDALNQLKNRGFAIVQSEIKVTEKIQPSK